MLDYIIEKFNIDSNTAATIVITLSIFSAGILINYMLKLFNGYRSRKNIRKVFFQILNDLVPNITIQYKEYLKTAEALTFEAKDKFIIKRAELFQLKCLMQIGYTNSFNAVHGGFENLSFRKRKNLRIKAFNKLWKSIYLVDYWYERTFEIIYTASKEFNEYNKLRNEDIANFMRQIRKVFFELNNKDVEKGLGIYLMKIDDINKKWEKLPNNTNPKVIHENLVLPIKDLFRENMKYELAKDTIEDVVNAMSRYEDMDKVLRMYRKMYNGYYKLFKGNKNLIKASLSIMKRLDENVRNR